MGLVSWLAKALFVIAVPIFLVTGSISWAFNSPGLYEDGFEKYQIARISGITPEDLRQVGADLRSYLNSRDGALNIRTRIFGTERTLFNSREIAHMHDVKRLVWGVYILALVSAVYLLVSVVAGFAVHRRPYGATLARRAMWGGGLTLVLLVVFGLVASTGFDALFLKFHQLSFANDFWKLDPRTDYLVRLFPQEFWFDATMWAAVRAITGALILTAVGGSYAAFRFWLNRLREATRLGEAGEV